MLFDGLDIFFFDYMFECSSTTKSYGRWQTLPYLWPVVFMKDVPPDVLIVLPAVTAIYRILVTTVECPSGNRSDVKAW
jgi:hypothetical protein